MKRFTAETFAKYRHPSSPLISPDGRLTAFVLTETDLEKNCYRADLWVLENETGTVGRPTAGLSLPHRAATRWATPKRKAGC